MQCSEIPDDVVNTWTQFNQMYWNGFVSQQDYEEWRELTCDSEEHRRGKEFPKCDEILQRIQQPENLGVDFNGDDAFSDYCSNNGTLDFPVKNCKDDSGTVWNVFTNYMSQTLVAQSLNADYNFNENSNFFDFNTDVEGMLPFYAKILLKKPSVRILVYSGLSDIATVPFSSSMPCLHKLSKITKSKIIKKWQPWNINENHSGGHWQQWDNHVTFVTVRGAGHEVPMYQPYLSKIMFQRFLLNGTL